MKNKKYLLIKTLKEKIPFTKSKKNLNNIKQFLLFTSEHDNLDVFFKYYKDFIFEISDEQYSKLSELKNNEMHKMTKKDLFMKYQLEEFLI